MNSPKVASDEESRKEMTLSQASPTLLLNPELLHVMTAMMGKEVLVETKDGKRFRGTFASAAPDLSDVGVFDAYEITDSNQDNLLPLRSEITKKMQFHFDDVICFSVRHIEAVDAKGFTTDSFYHDKNGVKESELQLWEGDETTDFDIENMANKEDMSQGYWSIDDMYKANDKLGVRTTYEENLTQYTNAEVIDDPNRRDEVNRIAHEIEKNKESKKFARLENDDEERDLNKLTLDEDFEHQRKRGTPRGRGNALPINRRAEALRPGVGSRGMQNNRYTPNQSSPSRTDWKDSSRGTLNRDRDGFNSRRYQDRQNAHSSEPRDSQGRRSQDLQNLRNWKQEFNLGTNPPKDEPISSTSQQADAAVEGSSVASPSPRGSVNAWNNGPPQGLVNAHNGNQRVSTSSPTASLQREGAPDGQSSQRSSDNSEPVKKEVEESRDFESAIAENEANASPAHEDVNAGKPQDTAASVKQFQFNLNAPAFVPGQKSTTDATIPMGPPPPITPSPITTTHQLPNVSSGMPVNVVGPPPVMIPQNPMVLQYTTAPQMYQPMGQPYTQYAVPQTAATQRGPPIYPAPTLPNRRPSQQQPPQPAMVFGTPHYSSQVYQTSQPINMQTAQYFPGTYPTTSVPPPQPGFVQQMTMASPQPVVSMAYMSQQAQYSMPPMGPGIYAQMAATGGVAIGTPVGHPVGHMLPGGTVGVSHEASHSQAPTPAPVGQQYANPSDFEWKQYSECTQPQSDMVLCQGYNEAAFKQQCRSRYP
ncbi:unnamed protein product, partial [Mesorhabditis belari]|uniref:Ataxin 2 SM domain-containing protein n=1 Tax=Mesorhabditis belari TaxID=2138241 RepID=A0AAF3J1X0_9BILA